MINVYEALKLLGLSEGHITPEDVKTAYRKAAFKYHPDRNPAGHQMMQMINEAYESAKNFTGDFKADQSTENYDEKINDALNAIWGLNLIVEICGTWIWVTGNTKNHKDALKVAGFKWSPKKGSWYFRAEENKRRFYNKTHSMEEIRSKYGSEHYKDKERKKIAA